MTEQLQNMKVCQSSVVSLCVTTRKRFYEQKLNERMPKFFREIGIVATALYTYYVVL